MRPNFLQMPPPHSTIILGRGGGGFPHESEVEEKPHSDTTLVILYIVDSEIHSLWTMAYFSWWYIKQRWLQCLSPECSNRTDAFVLALWGPYEFHVLPCRLCTLLPGNDTAGRLLLTEPPRSCASQLLKPGPNNFLLIMNYPTSNSITAAQNQQTLQPCEVRQGLLPFFESC